MQRSPHGSCKNPASRANSCYCGGEMQYFVFWDGKAPKRSDSESHDQPQAQNKHGIDEIQHFASVICKIIQNVHRSNAKSMSLFTLVQFAPLMLDTYGVFAANTQLTFPTIFFASFSPLYCDSVAVQNPKCHQTTYPISNYHLESCFLKYREHGSWRLVY